MINMGFDVQYQPQGNNDKNRKNESVRKNYQNEIQKRSDRRPVHKPPKKDR